MIEYAERITLHINYIKITKLITTIDYIRNHDESLHEENKQILSLKYLKKKNTIGISH